MSEYPSDADAWKSFDPRQASDCLDFRNAIAGSQIYVNERLNVTDAGIAEYANFAACKQGIYAWELAQSIRKAHGLKEPPKERDYLGHLKLSMASIENSRDKMFKTLLRKSS